MKLRYAANLCLLAILVATGPACDAGKPQAQSTAMNSVASRGALEPLPDPDSPKNCAGAMQVLSPEDISTLSSFNCFSASLTIRLKVMSSHQDETLRSILGKIRSVKQRLWIEAPFAKGSAVQLHSLTTVGTLSWGVFQTRIEAPRLTRGAVSTNSEFYLPNLVESAAVFALGGPRFQEMRFPRLAKVGTFRVHDLESSSIKRIEMPQLLSAKDISIKSKSLTKLLAPKLRRVQSFQLENARIASLELPMLEAVEQYFMVRNTSVESINLRSLRTAEVVVVANNLLLVDFDTPAVEVVEKGSIFQGNPLLARSAAEQLLIATSNRETRLFTGNLEVDESTFPDPDQHSTTLSFSSAVNSAFSVDGISVETHALHDYIDTRKMLNWLRKHQRVKTRKYIVAINRLNDALFAVTLKSRKSRFVRKVIIAQWPNRVDSRTRSTLGQRYDPTSNFTRIAQTKFSERERIVDTYFWHGAQSLVFGAHSEPKGGSRKANHLVRFWSVNIPVGDPTPRKQGTISVSENDLHREDSSRLSRKKQSEEALRGLGANRAMEGMMKKLGLKRLPTTPSPQLSSPRRLRTTFSSGKMLFENGLWFELAVPQEELASFDAPLRRVVGSWKFEDGKAISLDIAQIWVNKLPGDRRQAD